MSGPKIGVVDYDAGNIASVTNALKQIGASFVVTSDPSVLESCGGILLPGVGAAPGAMRSLQARGLVEPLRQTRKPLLGICLGMQLLLEHSQEGDAACLGVIPGKILRFDDRAQKVPHMGWNRAETLTPDALFEGIAPRSYFYYANSYYAPVTPHTIASTEAIPTFSAAMRRSNFAGAQFHPEKSGEAGLRLLKNFEALCR